MHIALFGGTFDPPHLGHKLVADTLIERKIVDGVWFVPVHTHPWAGRYDKVKLRPFETRIKMLELLLEGTTHQIALYTQVSFTYDTLEYFKKKHPKHTFSWVMGSEYLTRFDDFLAGHPKLLDHPFYIYPRSGYPLQQELCKKNMTLLRDFPQVEISSTEVRAAASHSQPLTHLLGTKLEEFVAGQGLYTA